jgi:hypothetical protein
MFEKPRTIKRAPNFQPVFVPACKLDNHLVMFFLRGTFYHGIPFSE